MNISIVLLTFFGLLPSSIGSPNNNRNLWILIGFLTIAVELFVALQFDIFHGFVGILRAIEVIKFTSPLIVHCISLLEIRVKGFCEKVFQKAAKPIPQWILVYVFVTEITKLVLAWNDAHQQIQKVSSLTSTLFIKTRFILHTYYSLIIHGKLKEVSNRLRCGNAQDFLITKTTYNHTVDMLSNLQEFYSFSLMCMYAHIFFNITADVYWIYVLCLNEIYLDILISTFFIIDNLVVLYLPLRFCDWSLATVREIGLYLGHYSSVGRCGLTNFALQLINNPFRFEIFGFLRMNSDFMKEILITIITYLIILMQFTPSDNLHRNIDIAGGNKTSKRTS